MKVICRFHDSIAANKVCGEAQRLTNVKLFVSFEKYDIKSGTEKNNAGYWAICCNENLDIWDTQKLDHCIQMGIQLALAEELKVIHPSSFLLTIWHIKNKDKIDRYDINLNNY